MNREFSKIMKNWKDEARADGVILISQGAPYSPTLTIYTGRPGALIGKAGQTYYKYKEIILKTFPHIKEIKLVETDGWYIK